MRYISTRGNTAPMTFIDAVLTGLAPDGGLLVPESFPDVSARCLGWHELPFVELAKKIVPLFVDDIPRPQLDTLIDEAYLNFTHPHVVDLVEVGDVQVLELFHGPTLAFKDVALQFLGRIFEYVLTQRQQRLNILAATSGDTGSAAIAGVRGQPNVDIFVMYPAGRVSELQELQMTTISDANVHCLALAGSFDDCQQIMKSIFGDLEFKERYRLGAVNSVNWARILAQIVYYAYASLRLGLRAPVSFCVPTGNFGNIFAGFAAKRMGFPIDRLVIATNANDILSVFFNTGEYRRGEVHYTPTPAMDIQVASNFERFLYYHLDRDSARLCAFMQQFAQTGQARVDVLPSRTDFVATAVSTEQTLQAIKQTYAEHGYVADPHTAVGLAAAEQVQVSRRNGSGELANVGDGALVCIGTAHPAKFPESVDGALGAKQARHERLDALCDLPARRTELPADITAVKEFMVSVVER